MNDKDGISKSIQVSTPNSAIQEWQLYQKQCQAFIASGFLPDHITRNTRSPQEAIARAVTIAWKGRELGIPILQSFSSITVISGKPCLSSELMLALCYKHVPEFRATFTTPADKQISECTLIMQRKGGDPQEFRFTIEDAKRAGVVRPNSPWEKYPAAMLRARTISAAARAVCPDAVMGCYTVEELGGDVIDGEIMESGHRPPEKPKEPEKPAAWKPPVAPATPNDFSAQNPAFIITQKQVGFLMGKAKDYGFSELDVDSIIMEDYNLDSKKKLTRKQMDEVIEFMRGEHEKEHSVMGGANV